MNDTTGPDDFPAISDRRISIGAYLARSFGRSRAISYDHRIPREITRTAGRQTRVLILKEVSTGGTRTRNPNVTFMSPTWFRLPSRVIFFQKIKVVCPDANAFMRGPPRVASLRAGRGTTDQISWDTLQALDLFFHIHFGKSFSRSSSWSDVRRG